KSTAFVRRIANGRPGLSAYSVADKIVLTIGGHSGIRPTGSYEKVLYGAPVSTPAGVTTIPAYPGASAPSSPLPTTIVYTDVLLSKETLEHVQGEISSNIEDKITEMLKTPAMKKSVAHNVFQSGGKHFFAYYLPDSNTFVVRQISE